MSHDSTVNPWSMWMRMLSPWTGWGEKADADLLQRRAQALLVHAHQHSPFYRRHHGVQAGAALPPWHELAPVRKKLLMQSFNEWVTDPELTLDGVREFVRDPSRIGQDYLGRYAVWTSSGTTGEPGIFVQDRAALGIYATLLEMRMDRRMSGGRWWSQAATGQLGLFGMQPRNAMVLAIDGHYAGVTFWHRQCRSRPLTGAQSRAYSVIWPIERICAELQAWQPAFLASYPSMLVELARQQQAGAMQLAPLALWSGGEGLAPSTRVWLESVFGAPVINDYGASECLSIAFECPHGRLHLNDDWVMFEPIDAAGAPVPPGVASHAVLLTNLANRVQPLIRYELGDSITIYPDPCPCGNHRPSFSVEGRGDDTLEFHDERGHTVHLSPMALTTAVEEGADIHRFQLRQTSPSSIDLRLADHVGDEARRDVLQRDALQALDRYLRANGLPGVSLRFDPQLPEQEARSGKLRQVVRLV